MYGAKSYTIVFLAGMFLFVPLSTFVAGCNVQLQNALKNRFEDNANTSDKRCDVNKASIHTVCTKIKH